MPQENKKKTARKDRVKLIGVAILIPTLAIVVGGMLGDSGSNDVKNNIVPSTGGSVIEQEIPNLQRIQPQPTPQPSPLSNDNYYINSQGNKVHSPAKTIDNSIPAGASAQCRDGTYSFSQSRRGTCSHHGGVARWLR
jgi:hypothetical protein